MGQVEILKKSTMKIALVSLVAFIMVALLIAVIVLSYRRTDEKEEDKQKRHWTEEMRRKKSCSKGYVYPLNKPIPIYLYIHLKCGRSAARWKVTPVIMISLDGFRADYLLRNATSNIEALIRVGSHSTFMYPSYPSKTFPNHYTIVTGLYPEAHGIVDNEMYDAEIGETKAEHRFTMKNSANPKWWLGEPIWNSVQKNGLKSAAYFWVGSDRVINGMRPNYWMPYNTSTPFYSRVDKALEWLLMPDDQRPSLICLYFNQPDEVGHRYGPDASQIKEQLIAVDGIIGYLMTNLQNNDLIGCVNIIISADHGMELITQEYFVDKLINITGLEVFSGVVGRIHVQDESRSKNEIADQMAKLNLPFRIYTKEDLPKRLHYASSKRIGEIVMDGNAGAKIFKNKEDYWNSLGDHGYDYKLPTMHALFLAAGASIKVNYKVAQPFQNIEMYNLVADLLNLADHRAPNNGTDGLLHEIFTNPPTYRAKEEILNMVKCHQPSTEPLLHCQSYKKSNAPPKSATPKLAEDVKSTRNNQHCVIHDYNYNVIFDDSSKMVTCLFGTVQPDQVIVKDPSEYVVQGESGQCEQFLKRQQELGKKELQLFSMFPIADQGEDYPKAAWKMAIYKSVMFKDFYQKVWTHLMDVVLTYVKQYGAMRYYVGPVFDYDHNGLFDDKETINIHNVDQVPLPTHYYCILLKCGQTWTEQGDCNGNTNVTAFILPNVQGIRNNMTLQSYLFSHTARVRDVELLTGLRFFLTLEAKEALERRSYINQVMWL